jgi:hypothetical protein
MKLHQPRGPVTEALFAALTRSELVDTLGELDDAARAALADRGDILYDEDLQLALFCMYELHYSGLESVDERWEWHPGLLGIRARIEEAFEARLRDGVSAMGSPPRGAQEVSDRLFAMAEAGGGPSVPDFIARRADTEQVREFLVHKSVYQLKEADPHTWAIPRLSGRSKSALVEIQSDEYGGGRRGHMHSELFARTMEGLRLGTGFGDYLDHVPAISLASVNAMSLFGLQRRLRGAIAGHLAIYEMTSSIPSAKYARGFRRLGFGAPVTDYFDEHVEADAVHEQIAGRDLAGGLIEEDPRLASDVFFGAATVCLLDELVGTWQHEAWTQERSSLRVPLPAPDAA